MARHPRWVRRFLSDADLEAVARAVAETETRTSGEIRVHLDATCAGDPLRRAVAVFERLGMHRTSQRNGILVYLAIEDRKLAVIGDAEVHARVPDDYWPRLTATLADRCRAGRPQDGLITVVRDVGELLSRHFPHRPDDRNELSDEVSLG